MKRLPACLLCLCICIFPLCGITSAFEEAENGVLLWECDTLDGVLDFQNVSLYEIVSGDREAFYDDFTTLQRSEEGESFVELAIPAACTVTVTTYHWPQEMTDFQFFVSADGEEWNEPALDTSYLEADGKWTVVTYEVQIEDAVNLRIYWPENPTWWTPLISAVEISYQPYAASLVLNCDEELMVPRYDTARYPVSTELFDQFAIALGEEIELSILEPIPDGVTLTEDGMLIVSAEAEPGVTFTLQARCASDGLADSIEPTPAPEPTEEPESTPEPDSEPEPTESPSPEPEATEEPLEDIEESLVAVKVITLTPALLGELNGDGVIDRVDLTMAMEAFGKTDANEDWLDVRLADINEDRCIDILDVAYIAKQIRDIV